MIEDDCSNGYTSGMKTAVSIPDEVFEEAAYSQPVPFGKAKHIKLNAGLEPKQIAAGSRGVLTIRFYTIKINYRRMMSV